MVRGNLDAVLFRQMAPCDISSSAQGNEVVVKICRENEPDVKHTGQDTRSRSRSISVPYFVKVELKAVWERLLAAIHARCDWSF
jgi:hypothetical protein